MLNKSHFFPFGKIPKNSKVVLYGGANIGRLYASQIKGCNYCSFFVVDKNWKKINDFSFGKIYSPEYLLTADYDFIVISALNCESILRDLKSMGISQDKIIFPEPIDIDTDNGTGTSYGGKLYSQHGDDVVVFQIFQKLGIEKPSYIDIGAHHPQYISNTALLYKFGSRGINIDANPNTMKNFYEQRPDDINLNVGIDSEKGILPFYMFADNHGCNTFSLETVKHFQNLYPNMKVEKTIQVPVITLQSVIDEYCNGKFPDYMDIDIEGLDYKVLNSLNFSASHPLVICVEVDKADINLMNNLLQEKGYEPYCVMESNMIYIRKELKRKLLGF